MGRPQAHAACGCLWMSGPRSVDRRLAGRVGDLETLIAAQEGLVARRQLRAYGVGWDAVDHHLRARRWAERSPRVVSTFTGALTVTQYRWLAVLHAGPRS